jgi:arsenite methyltransferase
LALIGACLGGAATIEETEELLEQAGFENIKISPNDKSRELIREWDPAKTKNAGDYVVSAYIEGTRPSKDV